MGDDHELRPVGEAADQLQEAVDVGVVERRLDLVEDVERRRAGEENREHERERHERLLAAREQREAPRRLPRRRHLDFNACGVLGFASGRRRVLVTRVTAFSVSGLASQHQPWPLGVDHPQAAAAAREEVLGQLLEVPLRGLEGLLERRRDLAVRVADQAVELGQRGLEIGALLGELLDVLERLGVLALRQRVHGPQRLTAAGDPLELALDLVALRRVKGLRRRPGLPAEHLRHAIELGGRLVAAVAQVGRSDLGLGERLRGGVEARLKARLRLGALAELGREVLGVAVGEHPALHRGGALTDRVADPGRNLEQHVDALEHGRRGHDAILERALAPLAEKPLDSPGATRGALGGVPHPGDVARPAGVARRGARAPVRLDRLVERGADAPQARANGVVAVVRRCRLLDERPKSNALAFELGGQLTSSHDEGLGADGQALVGGPGRGQPPPLRRPLTIAVGQALLDLGAPLGDGGQLGLDLLPRLARLGGGGLRAGEFGGVGVKVTGEQAAAQVGGLALEARVNVRGLRLALQRAEAAARLALDVEGPVKVVLRALQLELGAAAALAVLAEARCLLDQQAALARARVDDLLDPTLADHGVHLVAEVRIGERLDHVDQSAPSSVQPVLTLAATVEAPPDRDLGEVAAVAVAVVEDHLHLCVPARRLAVAAREDHVLHRLAADGQRALLAHRPEDRVGDVGLAAAVGPDDDADARRKLQPGALGERLEPLDGDRAQMHGFGKALGLVGRDFGALLEFRRGRGASYCFRRSSAAAAADCSAAFLLRPSPVPITSESSRAATSKRRSCAGPASRVTA